MTSHVWSLLEVCAFCCDTNEVFGGWAPRDLPCATRELANQTFLGLVREAERLYGEPEEINFASAVALGREWPGKLRIAVAGRLVIVRVAVQSSTSPALQWSDSDPDWRGIGPDWHALTELCTFPLHGCV